MVDVVTVMQRDVQQLGFPESFSQHVHGVFLDLPEPWKVEYWHLRMDLSLWTAGDSICRCVSASGSLFSQLQSLH